jgi:hypothetical protein
MVKVAIISWGIVGLIDGATISFFVSGAHQYRQTAFIELVYDSVFVAGFISLLSSRIAAFCLSAAALAALAILLWTRTFGHGPSYAPSLLLAIAIRPALIALVLFLTDRYERHQEVGAKLN